MFFNKWSFLSDHWANPDRICLGRTRRCGISRRVFLSQIWSKFQRNIGQSFYGSKVANPLPDHDSSNIQINPYICDCQARFIRWEQWSGLAHFTYAASTRMFAGILDIRWKNQTYGFYLASDRVLHIHSLIDVHTCLSLSAFIRTDAQHWWNKVLDHQTELRP